MPFKKKDEDVRKMKMSDEFIVSPVEGELRVRRDVELDRETTAYYNITVTAKDLGTPPLHSN
ncbi:cadherin-23 precursor [Silurus meridionalis]|nr:cadherin-23 precursor [Silurus meridionalis]